MKGKWQNLLNIASFVLLIVCVVRIGWLENEIGNLRNTMNNNRSMLQSSIDAINGTVRYELEQNASMLTESSWSISALDTENKTVVMDCYVIPKTYNPEKTTATIICNGTVYPMTLENGRYTAEITLPLFDETVVSVVNFTEDKTIRTQQLDWYINPRYDMVPTAYIYYSGSSSHDYAVSDITRIYSGCVEIDFQHKGVGKSIKKLEVVALVNDKEVWREKLKTDELYNDGDFSQYRAEIEHSFELKRGDVFVMYAEAVDENGWVYHSVLEDFTISDKGNPLENREYQQAEADIYDTDGNPLFEADRY